MGGTEHEPSGRTVQNQTAPFRAYMWIHEGVVSQQARWTAGAASIAGQGIPRAGGVSGRAIKELSRVHVEADKRKKGGSEEGGTCDFFQKSRMKKRVASEFWTAGKRGGARGGGDGDFYQE